MAALNVKSNILDLVCRTCLKINKQQQNIFEYTQYNKIVSNLIMECIPVKMQKEDGFPVNICNKCLEKLNIAWEFRLSVIESDIKLHNFYKTKSVKPKPKKPDKNEIKEEIKSEQIESTSPDLDDNQIKQENPHTIVCDKEKEEYQDISGEFPNNNADDSNSCTGELNEPEKVIEQTPVVNKRKRNYKRLNTSRNVNEKQAELLDNADYKRIVQLPISRREKTLLPVYCPDCNKSFSFQYFVTVHAHLHTGNLPFKCEKCDMRFPKRTVLKQHMLKHVKTRNHPCDLCEKSFFRAAALKFHKLQVHSTERPHKCELCGKTFKLIFPLQKHIKLHNNEKTHICEVCGKAFVDLGALTYHKRIHYSEKNFPCKICGKKFAYQRTLKTHSLVHTGERPYACDQCGRTFRLSMLLKQHMLIHTGEKPFTCEICSKKFRTRSVLILHMRTHTGETPYPCDLCSSAFKYRHHLINHKKIHHKDETEFGTKVENE